MSVPKKLVVAGALMLLSVAWFVSQQLHQSHQSALIGFMQNVPALADGALIRSARDERVYYMESNKRRWILSAEVLHAQGFRTQDIRTLPGEEVDSYQLGDPIDSHTLVTLPTERGMLPDIAPLAPYQLRLTKVNGRMVIKFTGSFWNMGGQSFWLMPGQAVIPTTEGQAPVYEHIVASDGSVRLKLIDNFVYHPAHHHLHLMDFGYYVFTPIRSASGAPVSGAPFVQDKTTFCMRDDEAMPTTLPGVPSRPVFNSCGVQGQGVSVGWIDVYSYTLVDQFVDVQDMPPGIYGLSFMLDPEQHYLEGRKDNNIATTFVQLDVAHGVVKVLASLAPFETSKNTFVDGTLIRAAETGNVYILNGGRKRWLRSVDIFNSYGFAWDAIYPVTQAMVAAVPTQNFVRAPGTSDIYALNENGYRRQISGPDLLASYRATTADVADVTQQEFAFYPEAKLIMRAGDDMVYSITPGERRKIGAISTLSTNAYDLRGLHIINDADFASYAEVTE